MIALKTLLFVVFVPGTVTVVVPYWMLSVHAPLLSGGFGVFRYPSAIPLLLGISIYLKCAWDFTFIGQGTPAPIDPPKELVIQGLYRYMRNPMYVGVVLQLLGEAWWFNSRIILIYAVLLWTGFHLFVFFYEEPTLRRIFGDAYERYLNTVPRWIPGWKRSRSI